MRILLAAKHAPHGSRPIGGVQSWCRTVANELTLRGYDVTTWGPEQGIPVGGFDLGIIANASDTSRAFAWCRKTLNICHGIIPAEKPATNDLTVFTSEEIRDHWHGEGPIIRQPIDTAFWSPGQWPLRINLTRFSYRAGLPFVRNIAQAMEMPYHHLRDQNENAVRNVLQKSGCVLATGRAALEAMSCDVPVVLCDHRSAYQGPLMDLDIESAMTRNYSGRGGTAPTVENVRQAIESAMESKTLRDHVIKHHRVEDTVDQLLGVAL